MPSREIADAFAECLITDDLDGAHDLVAPWLADRWTAATLERAWRAYGKGVPTPREWSVEVSLREYDDLHYPDGLGPPTESLPDELTEVRFREWIRIVFLPSEAERAARETCFEAWVATAEYNGDLCVGYLEFNRVK